MLSFDKMMMVVVYVCSLLVHETITSDHGTQQDNINIVLPINGKQHYYSNIALPINGKQHYSSQSSAIFIKALPMLQWCISKHIFNIYNIIKQYLNLAQR